LKTIFFYILLFCSLPFALRAQYTLDAEFPSDFEDSPRGYNGIRVVFYNVENLFDPLDDSLKMDESFTPTGNNNWSDFKYWKKQNDLAQVFTAVGGWEMPEVIGLCEIENRHVLVNLVHNTSLKNHKYGIVHHESPDNRGIDVALLYRHEKFRVLSDSAIQVRFPSDTNSRTRDVLYVKGLALDSDTLHIFVAHWPSKYGGAFVTIPKRKFVGDLISKQVKEIMKANPRAKIIIMGDFNDTPSDESVMLSMKAKSPDNYKAGDLINLMSVLGKNNTGSHFYSGTTGNEWSVIDQMVVNSNLMDANQGLYVKNRQAHIFSARFLLEKNDQGFIVTNRTFIGMKYHGGFSDHLPVYMDLEMKTME